MQTDIKPLSWQRNFKSKFDREILSIEDDFILFDNIKVLPAFDHPFKSDVTTFIICTEGSTRGKIGLKSYETKAPCMITLLHDEILQHEFVSDDFKGLFIVMSERMTDDLLPNIKESLPVKISVRQNPFIPLDQNGLELLTTYFQMLKEVVGDTGNLHRMDIVKHLIIAFYYHSNSCLHQVPQNLSEKNQNDELVERVLSLIESNYKEHRKVAFYADKVNLTAKYLSHIIKGNTGKSVNDWINECVLLEAKTLLKSSGLTIQQISDELNFVDQSIFGKFFKRYVGHSPKDYRKMV